jgi:ParB-like chromosome segregation protein Spo0J
VSDVPVSFEVDDAALGSLTEDVADETSTSEPAVVEQDASEARLLTHHQFSSLYPMMSDDEFAGLVADIAKHGQKDPIVLLEGQILDGRNRYSACLKLGREPKMVEYDGTDALAFITSANFHRRHLSHAQKVEVAAKLLIDQPSRSDRVIGRLARVDHKTVGTKRAALEARGEIPRVESREDTKGRSYAAHREDTPSSRREARDAKAVIAFMDMLHEGDINRRLNDLLGMLVNEKKRIEALPKIQREALARGFLAVLDIVTDDLRPIGEQVPRLAWPVPSPVSAADPAGSGRDGSAKRASIRRLLGDRTALASGERLDMSRTGDPLADIAIAVVEAPFRMVYDTFRIIRWFWRRRAAWRAVAMQQKSHVRAAGGTFLVVGVVGAAIAGFIPLDINSPVLWAALGIAGFGLLWLVVGVFGSRCRYDPMSLIYWSVLVVCCALLFLTGVLSAFQKSEHVASRVLAGVVGGTWEVVSFEDVAWRVFGLQADDRWKR